MRSKPITTIVGAGGIGKTTVANAIAETTAPFYRHGSHFVDLSTLSDPRLLAGAILGAVLPDEGASEGGMIWGRLAAREMLVVLDNCEHIIDAAAELAEQIARSAPHVRILATSREPLRIDGEWVHRLLPLEPPPRTDGLRLDQALRYSAVELFVEAAGSSLDVHALDADDLALIGEICIRLDGIPLAIELAAAQLSLLGLHGLARHLDTRFMLVTEGRRTALPRQQTLQATLEWSYGLLSPEESRLLRRLAVFRNAITVEGAQSAALDDDGAAVFRLLDGLSRKSLLQVVHGNNAPRFKPLETTRQFALEKLADCAEYDEASRNHAGYLLRCLGALLPDSLATVPSERMDECMRWVDDLRSALDWAFSPEGDEDLGLALTIAATPIWTTSFLREEGRRRLEQGIYNLSRDESRQAHRRMSLFAALASRLLFMKTGGTEISAAWKNSFEVAKELDDLSFRIWTVWGSWLHSYMAGQHRQALEFARTCYRLGQSAGSAADMAVGQLTIGISLFVIGNPEGALSHTADLIGRDAFPASRSLFIRFQWDPASVARCYHADALWLLGRTDAALQVVDQNLREAETVGHAPTIWNALAHGACPLAIRSGDLGLARRYLTKLHDISRDNPLWAAWADAYEGAVVIREGSAPDGARLMEQALQAFPADAFGHRLLGYLCFKAEGQLAAGDLRAAEGTILKGIDRARSRTDLWCYPELLRLRGELELRRGGKHSLRRAEIVLKLSRRFARHHRMRAWEERAAASLGALLEQWAPPRA